MSENKPPLKNFFIVLRIVCIVALRQYLKNGQFSVKQQTRMALCCVTRSRSVEHAYLIIEVDKITNQTGESQAVSL